MKPAPYAQSPEDGHVVGPPTSDRGKPARISAAPGRPAQAGLRQGSSRAMPAGRPGKAGRPFGGR